jgi:hypothetical protein
MRRHANAERAEIRHEDIAAIAADPSRLFSGMVAGPLAAPSHLAPSSCTAELPGRALHRGRQPVIHERSAKAHLGYLLACPRLARGAGCWLRTGIPGLKYLGRKEEENALHGTGNRPLGPLANKPDSGHDTTEKQLEAGNVMSAKTISTISTKGSSEN